MDNDFFDNLTVDQCHTFNTAMGNAVYAINKRKSETDSAPVQKYMDVCISDLEELIDLCNRRLTRDD